MRLLSKIRFASRKLRLGIRSDAVVLDVGCGQFPNPRADVACDMLSENSERSGDLKIDRPFVWARAEKLPFAADAFDFVVLSHVLEHTFEPELLLEEIQRVGRRGYIETPAAWQELLFPFRFHTLRVDLADDGALDIYIKSRWDDGIETSVPDVKGGLRRAYEELLHTRPEMCMTRLQWTRPIKYRVARGSALPWTKMYEAEGQPKRGSLAYGTLVKAVNELVRPRRAVDLLSLLACPDCHARLEPVSGKSDRLRCTACSLEFGKHQGYYDFVRNAQ